MPLIGKSLDFNCFKTDSSLRPHMNILVYYYYYYYFVFSVTLEAFTWIRLLSQLYLCRIVNKLWWNLHTFHSFCCFYIMLYLYLFIYLFIMKGWGPPSTEYLLCGSSQKHFASNWIHGHSLCLWSKVQCIIKRRYSFCVLCTEFTVIKTLGFTVRADIFN